ncbi:MAG: enoyl-CoA hydratase/isomerase family protein [Alphaproteobacteria bacterium]|nr:enoyl-CoA hydratase/isomerase family protein [Alphaproteobacteria bacterium]
MSDEILFTVENGVARVVLNRPAALNALTLDMVHALDDRLKSWEGDASVRVVTIEGAGEKAFCAGGDIRKLYDTGRAGDPYARRFFHDEYRLNRRIFRCPKPYVAYINGIVMGGGVGVSEHGSHRVAGERTTYAMPETGIGLFPDVGGGYFLPRLPGEIGMFLALTGARLKAADTVYAGLADYYIPGTDWPAVLADLSREGRDREAVSAVLKRHHRNPGPAPLAARRDAIDRAFGKESVEAVVAALAAEGEWGREQAAIIRTKSPTSLKVAFRQIRAGKSLDFEDVMRMEYRIATGCLRGHDFFEGVRALIVDKDNAPKWQPARIEDVDASLIDRHFATLPDELIFT